MIESVALSVSDSVVVSGEPTAPSGDSGKTYRQVRNGISAWDGKIGPVLDQTETEVVLRLFGRDDGGDASFDVRLPIGMTVPYEIKK